MARSERDDLPAKLRVAPGKPYRLRDPDAARVFGWERAAAETVTADNLRRLGELQMKMYADARHALLVVLQAIDGGGKDSTIRRVFGAFNPQGCNVVAFKAPSSEELSRDFLWRVHRHVPSRGSVTAFNRSHYEDVLVARVDSLVPKTVWERRYAQINDFERMLAESGTRVVKIFLHISHKEQKLGRLSAGVRDGARPLQHRACAVVCDPCGPQVVPRSRRVADPPAGTRIAAARVAEAVLRSDEDPHRLI